MFRVEENTVDDKLNQILSELIGMKTDISELKGMKSDISELKGMKTEISELKGMKTDISELKTGQTRLEVGQQKLQQNLIESLGTYTEKISEYVDDKTEALNKRVYKMESELERLTRQ